MQNIISLDTEKLARRGFQHEGPPPPPTHTGETRDRRVPHLSPGPDAYELLKTPNRLVRSQYCGIVWVKEEGSWRDLEICVSPKVGGRRPPSAPPPWKVGGWAPPCPPHSYAYDYMGSSEAEEFHTQYTSGTCTRHTRHQTDNGQSGPKGAAINEPTTDLLLVQVYRVSFTLACQTVRQMWRAVSDRQ